MCAVCVLISQTNQSQSCGPSSSRAIGTWRMRPEGPLGCPQCLAVLKDPVALGGCQHVTCRECVMRRYQCGLVTRMMMMGPSPRPSSDDPATITVQCVVCGCPSALSPGQAGPGSQTTPMPTRMMMMMAGLTPQDTLRAQCDEARSHDDNGGGGQVTCHNCEKAPATVDCAKCDASFCNQCFDKIHQPKFMANHEAVAIGTRLQRHGPCASHPGLVKSLFCEVDGVTLCPSCVITPQHIDHVKSCVPISEMMSRAQADLAILQTQLQTICDQLQALSTAVDGHVTAIQASAQSTRDSVSRMFDDVISAVQAEKTRALDQISSAMSVVEQQQAGLLGMVDLARAAVQESGEAREVTEEWRGREVLEVHQRCRDAVEMMGGVARVGVGQVVCQRAECGPASGGRGGGGGGLVNVEPIMQALRQQITVTLPSLSLNITT